MLSRPGNKGEQMILRSGLGKSTSCFPISRVLQPHIKTNLDVGLRAKHRIRTHDNKIGPKILANPDQAVRAKSVHIGQGKFRLHSRDTLRGYRAHLLPAVSSVMSQSENAVD